MYDPLLLKPVFSKWGISLSGSRFLVAFSGGLDSVVLGKSINDLAAGNGFSVVLGHVNHRLRPEADSEQAFCRELATRWSLPFYTRELNPCHSDKESIEAWARRERYAALEFMRQEAGAQWILTAHHADDQAETILMRLIQQAPLLGLAGIRPRRGKLLRPLLAFSRQQLRTWAERESLHWVEDSSNADQRFLRNRLRHGVMTAIMDQDETARKTLSDLAGLAQKYEAHCLNIATELAGQATDGSIPGTINMPVEPLLVADDDVFRLTLRRILTGFLGSQIQLSTAHWQNFRHFVQANNVGKVFDISESIRVLLDRGRLIFYKPEQALAPPCCPLEPGEVRWGYHDFTVAPTGSQAGTTGLWLRSWRSGDRTNTLPGGHSRLVSDVYVNARFSRLEKVHWPLVVNRQEEVVWLPGLSVPSDHLVQAPWSITWQTSIRK